MKLDKKELTKYLKQGYSLEEILETLRELDKNEALINKIALTFQLGSIEVSSSESSLDRIKETTLELMKNIKTNNKTPSYFR
jgi:predicted ATP-dependent serine protease